MTAKSTDKLVPCQFCGTPTSKLGTQMCDNCWEIEHRVRDNPILGLRIIAAVLEEKRYAPRSTIGDSN